jgi:hypothetical protein
MPAIAPANIRLMTCLYCAEEPIFFKRALE